MIDYVDPIPPIFRFLRRVINANVYGNTFPQDTAKLPAVLVRNAGGTDYTRIQIIARADIDSEAMKLCINVINTIGKRYPEIEGLRMIWVEPEAKPIPSFDDEANKPEAWCYMRFEHLEA